MTARHKRHRDADTAPCFDATASDDIGDALDARLARLFPGGLPNIYRTMARNYRVLAGLVALKEHLGCGALSEVERCLVALEVANAAECDYCEAALCHYSSETLGVPRELLEQTCGGGLPTQRRLALVVSATRALLRTHGKLGRAERAEYEAAGLGFEQLLEIIGVIGEYTMATYSANLDRTRIDPDYRDG
ncbi:carboxymuconolactone decarboxylase family protein [Roseovarius salinarum]|uniref:alkylhydroperoxidase n=1 Tax=Roseovarius salinarum TaxID=1981892 RepID=UPI0012FFF962|nr:alkylhydroperoxidase [Roseovarius salinarum]